MPYAAKQDYIDRFSLDELIQLTDKEGVGQVDDVVFARAQADGDAEIDSWLQGSYALPLVPVPTVLVRIACDLYRFYLHGVNVPEYAQKRYDAALTFLKSVNKGDVLLNPDNSGAPKPVTAVHVDMPARRCSRETLRDY